MRGGQEMLGNGCRNRPPGELNTLATYAESFQVQSRSLSNGSMYRNLAVREQETALAMTETIVFHDAGLRKVSYPCSFGKLPSS